MNANNRYDISPLYKDFQAFMEKNKVVTVERNKEIDELLIENMRNQLNIDKNTTAKEKAEINKISKAIVKKINKIEPNFLIEDE